METKIEPVIKKLSLNASCEDAFRHFTDNIHVWWPYTRQSLSESNVETVVFEAKPDGRIYEIDKAGREREWGRVTLIDPPNRIIFSWVLEKPEDETVIEVRFSPRGAHACDFVLIHSGWERHSGGQKTRDGYHHGWDGVLERFPLTLS